MAFALSNNLKSYQKVQGCMQRFFFFFLGAFNWASKSNYPQGVESNQMLDVPRLLAEFNYKALCHSNCSSEGFNLAVRGRHLIPKSKIQ